MPPKKTSNLPKESADWLERWVKLNSETEATGSRNGGSNTNSSAGKIKSKPRRTEKTQRTSDVSDSSSPPPQSAAKTDHNRFALYQHPGYGGPSFDDLALSGQLNDIKESNPVPNDYITEYLATDHSEDAVPFEPYITGSLNPNAVEQPGINLLYPTAMGNLFSTDYHIPHWANMSEPPAGMFSYNPVFDPNPMPLSYTNPAIPPKQPPNDETSVKESLAEQNYKDPNSSGPNTRFRARVKKLLTKNIKEYNAEKKKQAKKKKVDAKTKAELLNLWRTLDGGQQARKFGEKSGE